MNVNEEILEIRKTLKEHDKRLGSLESLAKGKDKRAIVKKKSILDHLISLKSEGFLDQPKTTKEIIEKLAQEGYHYPSESLTEPLQRAVRQGILGRIKKKVEGKTIWAYCKR